MDTCDFVEYYDWLYRTTRNDIMRDLILETILLRLHPDISCTNSLLEQKTTIFYLKSRVESEINYQSVLSQVHPN
jgi:hypothetical protein